MEASWWRSHSGFKPAIRFINHKYNDNNFIIIIAGKFSRIIMFPFALLMLLIMQIPFDSFIVSLCTSVICHHRCGGCSLPATQKCLLSYLDSVFLYKYLNMQFSSFASPFLFIFIVPSCLFYFVTKLVKRIQTLSHLRIQSFNVALPAMHILMSNNLCMQSIHLQLDYYQNVIIFCR